MKGAVKKEVETKTIEYFTFDTSKFHIGNCYEIQNKDICRKPIHGMLVQADKYKIVFCVKADTSWCQADYYDYPHRKTIDDCFKLYTACASDVYDGSWVIRELKPIDEEDCDERK